MKARTKVIVARAAADDFVDIEFSDDFRFPQIIFKEHSSLCVSLFGN